MPRFAPWMLAAVCCAAAPAAAFERATMTERAAADTATSFEVLIPPRDSAALDALLVEQSTPGSRHYHKWLTPAEYRARFGTDQATMDAAASELEAAGLRVVARRAHGLRVSGTASTVERAFGTSLRVAKFSDGRAALAASSALTLTPTLAARGAVIPAFSPVTRMRVHSVAGAISPQSREGEIGPYWFTDLKQAYQFPSYKVLDGSGVAIGILVYGAFNPPDMARYFRHEKIAVPALFAVNVNGGLGFSPENSAETHLDIQQSGGMAPRAAILHYNIPDLSDAQIADGLITIIEDNIVDIVSMSFGGPELLYTAPYNGGTDYRGILRAEDALFKQGNAQGITFVASSGDLGSNSVPAAACLLAGAGRGCGGFLPSAEFPASSPHVVGVGGSNLVTTSNPTNPNDLDSAYLAENAFYDNLVTDPFFGTPAANPRWGSGGGVSTVFRQPAWQSGANTGYAYRTVPDVAGHMGGCISSAVMPCKTTRSSDWVAIGGIYRALHGTSASAPDFAGLVALKAQHDGVRQGWLNPEIYAMAAAQAAGTGPAVFHVHVPGTNGLFNTRSGYDLVLGLGTVRGAAFVGLPKGPFAGVPQTESNP